MDRTYATLKARNMHHHMAVYDNPSRTRPTGRINLKVESRFRLSVCRLLRYNIKMQYGGG